MDIGWSTRMALPQPLPNTSKRPMKMSNRLVRFPRSPGIPELGYLLLLLFLLVSLSTSATQSVTCGHSPTESSLEHIYRVDVSSAYGNVTTHFTGIQILRLQSLDLDTFTGCVTWNLSWDEGRTWLAMNVTYTYDANRIYRNQDVALFTAWWIDPAVQLGDRISIHGEPPATDYFLRGGPFMVTDLVSLSLDAGHYTCWLLTYETQGGQQEHFYYERWTGLLIAAYSSQTNPPVQSRQMQLELQGASPSLPSEDPLTHLWLTFGSTFLSLGIAALAATSTYRVLHRLREHRLKEWLDEEPEHNA